MNVIGINGSPRKGWNTDLMVREALKGAESKGAQTELVHLYDMRFSGCVSCFLCKKLDGPGVGRCAYKDELTPLLDRIRTSNGLILGSPMYIGDVSASWRALIERLSFPCVTYRKGGGTFFEGRLPILSLYTMNCPQEHMKKSYEPIFLHHKEMLTWFFGGPVTIYAVTDTLQADDYSKYEMSVFDEAARKKRREEVFPQELKKAFDLGAELLG